MKVLIVYATNFGSTGEIAEFVGHILAKYGHTVTVLEASLVDRVTGYDVLLTGTPLYDGVWLPEMIRFYHKFAVDMGDTPIFAWATAMRVLENGGEKYIRTHYQFPAVLEKLNLKTYQIFAGKLLINKLSKTEWQILRDRYDGNKPLSFFNGDHRNWKAIRAWVQAIAAQLRVAA